VDNFPIYDGRIIATLSEGRALTLNLPVGHQVRLDWRTPTNCSTMRPSTRAMLTKLDGRSGALSRPKGCSECPAPQPGEVCRRAQLQNARFLTPGDLNDPEENSFARAGFDSRRC
jgi:hypothetical protein